jgi:hypothetical protein
MGSHMCHHYFLVWESAPAPTRLGDNEQASRLPRTSMEDRHYITFRTSGGRKTCQSDHLLSISHVGTASRSEPSRSDHFIVVLWHVRGAFLNFDVPSCWPLSGNPPVKSLPPGVNISVNGVYRGDLSFLRSNGCTSFTFWLIPRLTNRRSLSIG